MKISVALDKVEHAIAMVETSSIARGILVADGILKEAPVEMVLSMPTSGGYYLNLFAGEVEAVRSSWLRGKELAKGFLRDSFLLPHVHSQVVDALFHIVPPAEGYREAIGVLESFHMASMIAATDRAVKAAEVHLMHLHLGVGIGGNSFAIFSALYDELDVALKAGRNYLEEREALKEVVLIGKADPQTLPLLLEAKLHERCER